MSTSIARHKTAVSRTDLSRPVRLALDAGVIDKSTTVFDYGCGKGDDLRNLGALGIKCHGWDPKYRPIEPQRKSDVVNLGYVVNVIEDSAERAQALKHAWNLAKRVLVVSARLEFESKCLKYKTFGDGFVTQKGTFQKFYRQDELRDWVDSTLGVASVAAAPGVFLSFRDDSLRQQYEASQYRQRVSRPRYRISDALFERHKVLLEPLMEFHEARGRLPRDGELEEAREIGRVFGSVPKAFRVVRHVTGNQYWEKIETQRAQDFLVYLSLSKFSKRPKFSHLPLEMRHDTKAFFTSYSRACALADALLFSAGRMELIRRACEESTCGKLTPDALYVHTSGLQYLPPLLRVYEGCARAYLGRVEDANILKLNRLKPKVSYLAYPDFDDDPHPALSGALVLELNSFHVKYLEFERRLNPPILHRKELFVPKDHPEREKFERLTREEERFGLFDNARRIGFKDEWERVLRDRGLTIKSQHLCKVAGDGTRSS